MPTYNMEKVLYFASQKPNDGFNVRDSEQKRGTDLWKLVSQASGEGWMKKSKGTEQWFLTLAGYQQLLREKLNYHTAKNHTDDVRQLKSSIQQLDDAFATGVGPKWLYTPEVLNRVLAGNTVEQLLADCLGAKGLMLSRDTSGSVLSDALAKGLIKVSDAGCQITHEGIKRSFHHRAEALKSMGAPPRDFSAEQERLETLLRKLQASVAPSTLSASTPTPEMLSLLNEAISSDAVVPDVLCMDETRRPAEQSALSMLLSAGYIQMITEDDAGTYYGITDRGRAAVMEPARRTSAPPGLTDASPSLSVRDIAAEMPPEVMRDLSLYRLFVENLACLRLSDKERESINDLAVDMAFEDGTLPSDLVQSWVDARQGFQHPSEYTQKREAAIALATELLGPSIATCTSLPINEMVEMSQSRLGFMVPFHEADGFLREAQSRAKTQMPSAPRLSR